MVHEPGTCAGHSRRSRRSGGRTLTAVAAALALAGVSCPVSELQTALVLEVRASEPVDCVSVLATPESGGPIGVDVVVPDRIEDMAAEAVRVAVYGGGDILGAVLIEAYGREIDCEGDIVADLGDAGPLWLELIAGEAVVHELMLGPVAPDIQYPPGAVDCDDEEHARPDLCPCRDGDTRGCFTLGPKEMAGVGQCEAGIQSCKKGAWGPCEGQIGPSPEECNGIDNSCDGIIDTPWLLPRIPCERTQGVCAMASRPCIDGVLELCTEETYSEASGGLYNPGGDLCYGLDNDCDGRVDYGCECNPLIDEPRPCYSFGFGLDDPTLGVGACHAGTQHCMEPGEEGELPEWGDCIGETIPRPEICDGTDRSCSGVVDDVPGIGEPCDALAYGTCRDGTLECLPGQTDLEPDDLRLVCLPGEPAPVDLDCDGEDATCTAETDDEIADCGDGWLCCDAECYPPESLEHCGRCRRACPEASNPCRRPACSGGMCVERNRPDGAPCDDAGGTVCRSGSCELRCYIGGSFYQHGSAKPGNSCQYCDAYDDPFEWTLRPEGHACSGGTCQDGRCALSCPLPWGGSIVNGASVTAYQTETVGCYETCSHQTRICNEGELMGSAAFESCEPVCESCPAATFSWGAPHDCQADFPASEHEASRTRQNTVDGRLGSATYSCDDGQWVAGTSSCQPEGCSFGGTTLGHGDSITAYEHQEVSCDAACPSETRTCSYGQLSGTFAHASCAAVCDDCVLDGQAVAHGTSTIAWESASVPCGEVCSSEQRECYDGTLSGSFGHSSCEVEPCPCEAETMAWGEHGCEALFPETGHGASATAANTVEGRSGSATASCDDGEWGEPAGDCLPDGCVTPWMEAVAHGGQVAAHADPHVGCYEECESEVRTCEYGVLDGQHEYPTCVVVCSPCPEDEVSWQEGGTSCSGVIEATEHGETREVTASGGGRTGSATFDCLDGEWQFQEGTCSAGGG